MTEAATILLLEVAVLMATAIAAIVGGRAPWSTIAVYGISAAVCAAGLATALV